MKKHINTFSQGINQDISTNKYPNTNFYWAENFRFVSKDGLATGALTNVDGNNKILSLGNDEERVIGMVLIRETLVIFVSSPDGGKIYIWEHNDTDYEIDSPILIYSNLDLNFDPEHPIKAVGRYETPTVQKVYFTDGYSFFKHLNIIPQGTDTYPLNYELESLDLVPDVEFSNLTLSLEAGGNLKAGKISYAYQFYSVRGSESVISPESNMISLTNSSDTASSTLRYKGEEIGTSVNKSVNITVENTDQLFERVRIYALEYTVYDQVPKIRIVGEYDIDGVSVNVLDSGQSIGEITLEEFRFIQKNFYPKTIDSKNNYLFAANITEEYFRITDEQFDARAFRFNSSGEALVKQGENSLTINYSGGTLSNIPEFDHEAYNPFNSVHSVYGNETNQTTIGDINEATLYKYNPEKGTLGGYGPNIKYEFITKSIILDEGDYNLSGYIGRYPLQTCETAVGEDYSKYDLEAGYQRDEVYRFGIVFFDKKGRQSFAKWIGDIKFPNNIEMPFVSFRNNKTYGNILGIRFEVTIPSELESIISGYQIVRVNRTSSDKTILGQGLIGYLANGGPGNANTETEDWNHMMSQASVPLIGDLYNETSSYLRETPELFVGGERISGNFYYTRGSSSLPIERSGEVGFNPKYIEFTSPEVAFNKRKFTESSAFIEAFGTLGDNQWTGITGPEYIGDDERNSWEKNQTVSDKFRSFNPGTNNKRTRAFLSQNKVYQPREPGSGDTGNNATIDIQPDGKIFNNKTCNLVDGELGIQYWKRYGLRGTFNLCTVDTLSSNINNTKLPLSEFYNGNTYEALIGNYKINKGKSQYGGTDYEARSYNTYYPVSRFVSYEENTTLDPNEIETTGLIEILRGGNQVLPNTTIMMTTITQQEFYVKNYGNKPVNVTGLQLSALSDWLIVNSPVGTIDPGESAYFRISYTGPSYGMSYTSVLVQSDADNGYFQFTLGVDYINNPADTPATTIQPHTELGSVYDLSGLTVFNGDTFINFFAYARSLFGGANPDDGDSIDSYVFFPVESSINLNLRLDNLQSYINWSFLNGDDSPGYKVAESIQQGVLNHGAAYPQDLGDLYRYNSAYSTINKGKEYYAEPFDFIDEDTFDVRITNSELKINGEYTDNWTVFKFNNVMDVDSKHDAITKIVTFKNYLFYIQPTAIGVASVNQRSLISDNNPGQLALGTGGVLERYDYITEKSGSEFYYGIETSDDYLYYVDGRRKRINKIVPGKEEAISIIKGIDSTLDKLAFETVKVGFDRGYNEIICSIDGVTMAFNEPADAFTSAYSFVPGYMISIGGDFYTTAPFDDISPWLYMDPQIERVGYSGDTDVDAEWDFVLIGPGGQGEGLYKHNIGEPGTFYGGDGGPADSTLTLIINPEGKNICYFDTLDLITESKLSGVDYPDDIFYRMEASNNYQEITRELNFSSSINENVGTIKRIGRQWRTPIMPIVASGSTSSRMVDTYLKVKLYYENKSNTFRVHDITTLYRPANH